MTQSSDSAQLLNVAKQMMAAVECASLIGKAILNDRVEDKKSFWADPFEAFWPGGPESNEYLLMDVTPDRLELRSFILGVAEEPTRWSPVTLERAATGAWQQTG